MAVTEIETPYSDVLVGRAGDYELAVPRYVHRENGKLVSVKVEVELEAVDKEHLDGAVEESDGKELCVGREAHAQDVVAHLQRSCVHQLQPRRGPRRPEHLLLNDLEIPELGQRMITTNRKSNSYTFVFPLLQSRGNLNLLEDENIENKLNFGQPLHLNTLNVRIFNQNRNLLSTNGSD